jgi:hypothetical protein
MGVFIIFDPKSRFQGVAIVGLVNDAFHIFSDQVPVLGSMRTYDVFGTCFTKTTMVMNVPLDLAVGPKKWLWGGFFVKLMVVGTCRNANVSV